MYDERYTLFSWQDKRNFLRDPPAGVHFHFDFEQMYPVAMVMLEEDELLRKMRFYLVPKQWEDPTYFTHELVFLLCASLPESRSITPKTIHCTIDVTVSFLVLPFSSGSKRKCSGRITSTVCPWSNSQFSSQL